jgi:hypothetical protein
MKKTILFLFVFLAGCSPVNNLSRLATQPAIDSGVAGQALLGPTCPVVRIDNPCPDQPYQTTLIIMTPDGATVMKIETDAEGYFRAPLQPGDYILHPETPDNLPYPRAADQPFTVTAGQYTQLTVEYDSGIR